MECTEIVEGEEVTTEVEMKFFYAQCPVGNVICFGSSSGGFVPVITVCTMGL